jgi:hypothetical protein
MPKPRPYIAQVRVGFTSESDIHAESTMDYVKARIEEQLEDDDTVRITQIAVVGEPLVQEETLTRLRLARNELVRLEYKDTMNLAQQLDMVIWMLIKRSKDEDAFVDQYDYNRIIRIAESLKRGENPLY